MEGLTDQNQAKDSYNVAYIIHLLLGAGNLVPWNSFVTAVDYFEYLYPDKHVDKVFSVAYMAAALLILIVLMGWSRRGNLPGFRVRMSLGQVMFICALMIAPVTDWISVGENEPQKAYVVLVAGLVICGLADGLTMGSLIGNTGALPGRYMQAVFAGNASSGILVCILRIVTKASLPHSPKGLRRSTQIYFSISTFIIFLCFICCNLLHKLPVIQYHYNQKRTMTSKPQDLASELNNIKLHPNPVKHLRSWELLKRIRWPAFGILVTYIVTLSIFPGYLSENVESKLLRDWYPIILMTTYNVGDFLGKCFTVTYVPKSSMRTTWACMARIIFYPLFTMCIHGPKCLRSEIPVVFLTAVLGISNGYLTSVLMILAPKLVEVEESESVGIVMALFLVIGLALGSIVGWLWNI